MSDAFQEVEEEYRRQELAKLWEKYRIPLIGGAIALVASVAGYQGWTYWRGEQLKASSRAFDSGIAEFEADKAKEAADRFAKLATKAVGGYAMLSKLNEAAIRGQMGQEAEAAKLYDKFAEEESDELFTHMARLRAALMTVEKASLADTQKRLDPVIAGDSPWKAGAMELLAYANFRAGKNAEAVKLYNQLIALKSAPEKTKRRATEMKSLIDGGLTLAQLNAQSAAPANPMAPGLLPFGMEPPKPEAPGSLLGPDDAPILPNPVTPPVESQPSTP